MRGMIVNSPDASRLGLRSTLDPGIKVEIENGELCIRLDSTMRRGDSVLGYHFRDCALYTSHTFMISF